MNALNSDSKRSFWPDVRILLPIIILSAIGIITLLSTTILPRGGFGDLEIVYKQVLFVLAGIILFLIISRIDLSYLKHWQIIAIIYFLTLALLIITFFFAPTINNVRRWLVIAVIILRAIFI